MSQNLKARLARYRDTQACSSAGESRAARGASKTAALKEANWPGWTEAGFKTLKREISLRVPAPIPAEFPREFPKALAILMPDIFGFGRVPSSADMLFFDLETTGLSGGAGTVAFLAAFGRFTSPSKITINQYLLLDYPGEGDFIEKAVKELSSSSGDSGLPFVVSFNGKSFDFQIIKNRCLMNGIRHPEYFQADLLHPARRLWKNILPDCSQATIEVSVLGLDRTGDISGALAPEIWFEFLKTGENRELLIVCDHNVRDITGLAALFLSLGEIATDPPKSRNRFRFDEEALALSWRKTLKKHRFFFEDDESYQSYTKTGALLLETAARNGRPRAAFTLALDFFKKGLLEEGRALMLKIVEKDSIFGSSGNLRAMALKSLAIDAEWRLKDINLALGYTDSALAISEIPKRLLKELEKRRRRLLITE